MRFVSGPCSETQPAASSGRTEYFRVRMRNGLKIPCRARHRSRTRTTAWGRRRLGSGVRSLPLTRRSFPGRGSCSLRSYVVAENDTPQGGISFTRERGILGDARDPHHHPQVEWTPGRPGRSEEHTSELQSQSNLVCRLLLEKK